MRDLADFLPHVRPHAMACPEPVALKYLREAAREWCERTRMWRAVDEFTTSGIDIEVFSVPPDATLHEIEAAWFDGRRLEADRFKDGAGQDSTEIGQPSRYTQPEPGQIQLRPPGIGALRISVFLKPSEDAEVVPDFLYDHHARDIARGALAAIKMLPGQPYTDPNAAMFFGQQFEQAINRHFAANIRGQQRANVRARANFF